MKKLITILLITALYTNAFSQFVTTNRINTSSKKIYNIQTGKPLSDAEIKQLIKEIPNLSFDHVIDKYGELDHYEYDPNNNNKGSNKDISKRPKNGDIFPPFAMKSITNKTLDSEKLIGKNILLHFQLDFNKPFFFAQTLIDANELINELQNKVDITSIVVTRGSKKDILKEIDTSAYTMEFVSDAQNFNLKYLIFNYPTFILVDKYGHLVSYYDSDELNKIKEDLLKIK